MGLSPQAVVCQTLLLMAVPPCIDGGSKEEETIDLTIFQGSHGSEDWNSHRNPGEKS